jgi:hypothetical protein
MEPGLQWARRHLLPAPFRQLIGTDNAESFL